jgi:hypothetical protein
MARRTLGSGNHLLNLPPGELLRRAAGSVFAVGGNMILSQAGRTPVLAARD